MGEEITIQLGLTPLELTLIIETLKNHDSLLANRLELKLSGIAEKNGVFDNFDVGDDDWRPYYKR